MSLNSYLSYLGILMKDFKKYAQRKTAELIEASVAKAEQDHRPNRYLSSAHTNKEQVALDIAARDEVREGLICILRTVEPCRTYKLHRDRQTVAGIYPQLVRGAMIAFASRDVLRFLGNRPDRRSQGEVIGSYQDRPEGIRIKHEAHANSVKAYDKAGSILRTECTINNHRAFRVYRASERDPDGPKKTLPMSKGIADLYARSEVSGRINDRYLEALATLDTSERVEAVVAPICRGHRSKGKSIRALRPWSCVDQQLLTAVSAEVTYLLRLLREHKIIRRLPNTRKYRLTPKGAQIVATVFLTQNATTEQLNKVAA